MARTRLININIFDGTDVSPFHSVEFDDQRIAALWEPAQPDAQLAASTTVIDGLGGWLTPGLTDAHIHLELDPAAKEPPAPDAPRDLDAMAKRARRMVEAGITTARDLGGGAWAEFEIRDRILAGEIVGPRLLCSGQPVTSKGGHCHFWGGEVETLEQAKAVMQRQIDKGANLLKIMATGGRFTPNSSPSKAQFDLDFMSALVDAAKAESAHHRRALPWQ